MSKPDTGLPEQHVIERTRAGGFWTALTLFAIVLLLLLIFILQNGRKVDITLYWAEVQLPLAVALLLAAVFGALLAASAAGARILQLRRVAKKHRIEDRVR